MFYYFLWDEAKNNQQKAASDEILLRMNKFSAVVLIKKYIYDFLTAVPVWSSFQTKTTEASLHSKFLPRKKK